MYLTGIHHCYLRFIMRKVNANREQNLSSLLEQLCRDAALLMQKYKDFLKRQKILDIFLRNVEINGIFVVMANKKTPRTI